ncbi:hypothetical protein Tco_0960509, partial [Tanacetum coccineum]
AIQAPLRDRFRDFPEADMKEILHHRMWESNFYKAHEDHKKLYEALEKSMEPSGSSQLPPPPPPPSTNQSDQSTSTAAPSSSKTAASAEYTAWTTTDTRLKPSVSSIPEDLHMADDTAPDEQVHSSGDEDTGHDHIPTQGITELKQQDLEGPAYEIVKVFHPNVIHLQYQMEECHKLLTDQVDELIIRYNVSKPLPLGGPPGQVAILPDFFLNKDLEYLRYGSKGGRPAMSISKIKAAYYPDVSLEQMVPDQIWIKEECKYDIAAMDFKYLYPSDFEDLYLLNLQGHLNHLPPNDKKILSTAVNLWTRHLVIRQRVEDFQLGIESYQTQLNLTKPRWDITGFEFKHDFTVINSLRAVTFWHKYGVQMIMRFNEIHKFSNGTLHQIDEALDYKVKEYKKWPKTRRLFRNLESFVGRRVREGDYRLLQRTE